VNGYDNARTFENFPISRSGETMAEGGSSSNGRQGGRRASSETSHLSEERVGQIVSSRLQSVVSNLVTQVNARNDEIKTALEKLNDRLSGLEDIVKKQGEGQSWLSASSQETSSELGSPSKKSRSASSSDGMRILREFADLASVFKTRIRERLRRFCLSKEGHMYSAPHKKQVLSLDCLHGFLNEFVEVYRGHFRCCGALHQDNPGELGSYNGNRLSRFFSS